MDSLLVLAPALGCLLMMAPLMWLMSRGMNRDGQSAAGRSPAPNGQDSELADLRSELDRLRAEARGQRPGVPQDRT